ncbi:MAG: diguanylate cyclase [Selenomonadaceae bacterium]|nr:diguanylate cyclase [Selenomonadaceae bacterium]
MIIDNLPDINVVVRKAKQLNIVARNIIVDDIITGISASIGIAIAPYQGEDYETLFKAADEALYHVKQHGRNGYHCLLFDEESTNEKNFTF